VKPASVPAQRRVASAEELAQLHGLLRATAPLSDEELRLVPVPQCLSLPAGSALLRAGECAREVAVVLEGGLREYFLLADGTERTKGFTLPVDFGGSLSDLLSGEPSRTWVVAEQPSRLLVLRWSDYSALLDAAPGWQRFARVVAETLYRRKVEREYELLALDAAERYRRTLLRWPTLESCFNQRQIASYVGITPVHLSRLRAGLRRQGSGSAH